MVVHFETIPEKKRRPDEGRGEVNCAECQHLGDFDDEGQRGFCLLRRRMMATWHPVICSGFVKKTWERRTKVVWKGIVYG